ncbi:hypothetical protein AKO1_013816 [Acrasis kona]|uniref:Aminopeptidase n=1 Tax=Acrasis kona TaxID=1008807 RepID=A0AAW2YLS9_9EUKA
MRIFRSTYKDQNGENKLMFSTQFEATDARRALPCWDDSALKATFDLSLIVSDESLTLISNMPILSKEGNKVTFETTPIMSTYLLAWVIGELDYIEDTSADGIKVRVYAPKGSQEQGRFALNVATKAITYFGNYFNIKYQISKMDLIAIPDFSAGAMENWGCVTYRLTRLLVNESTSVTEKQATAKTVSHEIAHSWFGNQVTMQWWNGLWLNEGFARYIEHFAVSELFKEWDVWTQFVSNVLCVALSLDSLRNSHPVQVHVADAGQINGMFDTISYAKGGSLNRMLGDYFTPDVISKGLNLYLTRHAYNNATTDDLWKALGDVSGDSNLSAMMNTWVLQTGYPLIKITPVANTTATVQLSQERFLLDGTTDDSKPQWIVPIRYQTNQSNGDSKLIVLSETSVNIDLGLENQGDTYYKLNSCAVGDRLAKSTPADRLNLINDLFAFCQSNLMGFDLYLDMLSRLNQERDYYVWSEISTGLGYLYNLLGGEEQIINKLNTFTVGLYKDIYERLGWDATQGDGPMDSPLRALVINRLLKAKHSHAVDQAIQRFQSHVEGSGTLIPDLRSCVYSIVVSTSDRGYQQAFEIYQNADSHSEKIRALQSICTTKDTSRINELIQMTFESVRSQDVTYPISSLSFNSASCELIWEHVRSKWDDIHSRFGAGNFSLAGIVSSSTCGLSTHQAAQQVEQLAVNHSKKISGAERALHQAIEKIKFRANLYERAKDKLVQYLNNVK